MLPRKEGDFDRNDDVYEELQKHDKEDEDKRPPRSGQEMEEEAAALKGTLRDMNDY